MSPGKHRIYIFILISIVSASFIFLSIYGYRYYLTSLDQRFFHEQNELLKPSGNIGHGIGILGSSLMIIGVFGYMARKRFRKLSKIGILKHWLEFHIFLCVLGPLLVLFHSSFKIGGLVAISFWSMVAVVISGVIGRFIYLQIPRTIEGREMSLRELEDKKSEQNARLYSDFNHSNELISFLETTLSGDTESQKNNILAKLAHRRKSQKRTLSRIKAELKKRNIARSEQKILLALTRSEMNLNMNIELLSKMQSYMRYWHVAHLPFALLMLLIMLIHIVVVVFFGYTWIF